MQRPSLITKPCRYDEVGQVSRWTFSWMLPLFKNGMKKDLEMSDLYQCTWDDDPNYLAGLLEKEWDKELYKKKHKDKKPSLVSAIVRAFGMRFFLANLIIFVGEFFIRMAQPFMIGFIVRYLTELAAKDGPKTISVGIAQVCTLLLVISAFLYCFTRHRANVLSTRMGNNVRTALSVMVFKKVMKISLSSMEATDIGQVLNIMANDLNRFEELSWVLVFIVIGPLMAILTIVVTYSYIGISFIGSFVILCVFMLIQIYMGRFFQSFRNKTAKITDVRVNKMSEIISAMKLIKLYCWEHPFADLIMELRKAEVISMRKSYLLKGINGALFFISNRFMLFASFLMHILMGNTLDAETVFVIMSLYDAIRIPLTGTMPQAFSVGAETITACNRVQQVLVLKERIVTKDIGLEENGSIVFKDFYGKWKRGLPHDNLIDLNINVTPGKLVIVVGSVGSGKTCLLYSILKEIETSKGSISVFGDTSYAPQESWCFGASVKENILLSNEFDEKKYQEVIHACSLNRDLELFPDGGDTFVGEKGYTLSGGQKARVSLARAVYNDADIYLLDDPLSAVDPRVANHIFDNCIKGYLRSRGKTVILVTHQMQFIKKADHIILLKDGAIEAQGHFTELASTNDSFLSILQVDEKKDELGRKLTKGRSLVGGDRKDTRGLSVSLDEDPEFVLNEEPAVQPRGQTEEQRTSGAVGLSVFWGYLRAGGNPLFILLTLGLTVMAQALYQLSDLWLERQFMQSNKNIAETGEINSNGTFVEAEPSYWDTFFLFDERYNVLSYSLIMVLLSLCAFGRTIITYILCLRSSVQLHDTTFKALLRAPCSFYETNPLGRILNRCTRDVGVVDQTIPNTFVDLNLVVMNCVGVIVLSIGLNYWLLIPTAGLIALCVPIRNFYINTGRDLQRLDAIARSPVYSHISTAFNGLISVRSFGLQLQFEKQFLLFMQDSVACRFLVLSAGRAIGLGLDMVANIYITAVAAVVMFSPPGTIPDGDAGLILASSLQLMGFFQYAVRASADFETQMVSAERVMEYGRLEAEPPLEIKGKKMDPSWPQKGDLSFKNVSMAYNKYMPPVLKDMNLVVNAGEKIGIVGRTGAGKSSLISVLFRLTEAEGTIILDGQDIKGLGLHDLRNKISIIPQEPTLFSGTIRLNLDPFNIYESDQLWRALEDSNLAPAVRGMTHQLDAQVTEGGSNISVGQRQLLCLARALLKKNKILVCDEATANVDHETDEVIQKTIKTKFEGCTILTVAHRLNTIIDMDKVLVLDAGRIMEFDAPHSLLTNSNGSFFNMVQQTGKEMEKTLHRLASQSFFSKNKITESVYPQMENDSKNQ